MSKNTSHSWQRKNYNCIFFLSDTCLWDMQKIKPVCKDHRNFAVEWWTVLHLKKPDGCRMNTSSSWSLTRAQVTCLILSDLWPWHKQDQNWWHCQPIFNGVIWQTKCPKVKNAAQILTTTKQKQELLGMTKPNLKPSSPSLKFLTKPGNIHIM